MKNNETKSTILKLKLKETQIKVKKKSDNNIISAKANNKSNKIKESLFPRTSFNNTINSNFFSPIDLIPKISTNKNENNNTIIQSKKLSLNTKNKNKINDFEKINYKYFTNRKNGNPINLKESKKLNILNDKSKENISNNLLKESKSIRQSLNNNKLQKNKIDNNSKIIDINLLKQKSNNSYEKIKKLIETSSLTISNQAKRNHKKIKQNHSNLKSFEQIKNKENISPLNIKEIYNIQKQILPIKKNNSSTNSKYVKNGNANNNNSYNSCYNFYQNTNNINNNINRNNYNYNRMLSTINNFEFHNYSNIYRIEENKSEKNKTKNKKYIILDKENININNIKSNCITHSKNSVQTSDIKSITRKSIFNKDKQIILNKILNRDNKKLLEYKKKLIKYFCKSIEDFIYINVKNKFNDFIMNLKKFSIEKNSHYLLLKRLQNKSIQKNFYKDKDKTYIYKYSLQNEQSSNYDTNILMNNSNIINLKRNEKIISKGYIGNAKAISNLNKTQSPILNDDFEKNHKYFNSTIYSNNISSLDLLYKEDKENYNNQNLFNLRKNNFVNIEGFEKKCDTIFEKNNNNNLYIPKKLKLTNNSLKKTEDSYILNPYITNGASHSIFSKKVNNQNKKCNQSHEIYNDSNKTKKAIKKYGSNDNFQNMHNITNNFNNSKFNIYKESNFDFLNNTNDKIKNRNNHIIPGKTLDTELAERNSIYKKKLKINNSINMYSKPKLTKIRNQILGINLNLHNNSNDIIGQYLSPNVEKNSNQNLYVNKQTFIPLPLSNPQHMRITYTEPRGEIDLDSNNNSKKFGNIQELTVNLSKNRNNNNNINSIYKNKDNIFIYSQNDFDNCRVKEYQNNNNAYNKINEENNLGNDADVENDEFPLNEIIIKDLSSADNRLNVFIKYIEMPNIKKIFQRKSIYNNFNSLKYFQIDSFFIPASYQKLIPSNIYYKNYCLGNKILKNNKLKFNKILSSIIEEEEEKSKAANSVNNSTISDEENNTNKNNYRDYFIQSIKYISNLLQSIFDDKKKDSYHRFFKILKKIKNEAFLQGIINEKNSETLSKTKNEENDKSKEDNINTNSKE